MSPWCSARPRSATRRELQGLTLVQAYDGTQGWKINPFQGRKDPEKMSADDAKELAEDAADFTGALVDYKAKGYKLDYLGTEDVDGTDAHKLRVTRPNGDITYVYLDPDYFLEIRTINRRIEHGVPEETVTDYGDYEKVDGRLLRLRAGVGPQRLVATGRRFEFDKADANPALGRRCVPLPGARSRPRPRTSNFGRRLMRFQLADARRHAHRPRPAVPPLRRPRSGSPTPASSPASAHATSARPP